MISKIMATFFSFMKTLHDIPIESTESVSTSLCILELGNNMAGNNMVDIVHRVRKEGSDLLLMVDPAGTGFVWVVSLTYLWPCFLRVLVKSNVLLLIGTVTRCFTCVLFTTTLISCSPV